MKRFFNPLNIVFLCQLFGVFLIAFGWAPRELALFIAGLLLIFIIFWPLSESLLLVARSIPFFIALPLTDSFDSFNTWRLITLVVFIKWFLQERVLERIFSFFRRKKFWLYFWQRYQAEFWLFLFFFISFLSLISALDPVAGLKRIIYFLNISFLFVVVKDFIRTENYLFRILKNIILGGSLIIFIGLAQFVSAYFMSINDFLNFWAGQVSLGFYGTNWSKIVIRANTWFAYSFGSFLNLRLFSTMTSSHTFPLYLLMVAPCLLTLLLFSQKVHPHIFCDRRKCDTQKKSDWKINKKEKIGFLILLILLLECVFLSCTRGIWVSIIFSFLAAGYLFWQTKEKFEKWIIKRIVFSLILFLLLFSLSIPLFKIPQFKQKHLTQTEELVILKRLKSTLDLQEKSNRGRIFIWEKTLNSIFQHPWLGVGIGNFPVVLNQEIKLAKAGSSAHNLYLHIAAEIGLLGLVVFLLFLKEILQACRQIFQSNSLFLKIFGGTTFVYFFWILGYNLTDAAMFDGRVFLLFMLLSGCLLASRELD